MTEQRFKLVVYVPQSHLEAVRVALAGAGGGIIGKYDNCAFMTSGIGVYRPLEGSNPSQGEVGNLERVGEARIEVTVANDKLEKAIIAVKKVHPYEEPVIDIYKLEDF